MEKLKDDEKLKALISTLFKYCVAQDWKYTLSVYRKETDESVISCNGTIPEIATTMIGFCERFNEQKPESNFDMTDYVAKCFFETMEQKRMERKNETQTH